MAKAKKIHKEEESGLSSFLNRFKDHPFLFGGTVLLLLIIIVAFVFVPSMPSIQRSEENLVFGYYNGKAITQDAYFNNILTETAEMMDFNLQGDYGMNFSSAMNVWFQAFLRSMMHIAILDEMKNSGYEAPSGEIDRLVAARPEFLEDGRFSMVKYNNYGKNRQISLWNRIKDEYTTGKFYNDIMSLKISSAEKKFIGAMAYPERSFEMVSFPRSAFPESEVITFGTTHQDMFKTVHLSRITMTNEKEAQQLLLSIQSGKTSFEDAARNHSNDIDKDKGGDMGLRMAHEVYVFIQEETDRTIVTSLRKGEYSELLKGSGDTWIFFRAEETPYSSDLSKEENIIKIRSYMEQFEGGRIENWLVALMDEMIAGAKQQNKSLSEYIELLKTEENSAMSNRFDALQNVYIGDFGPVSLNYGNMGGAQYDRGLMLFTNTLNTGLYPQLAGADSNEIFWRNAFLTPLNKTSAPFTLGASIAVLTAVEENPGDETSMENIANFYQWGWMYNASSSDTNSSFLTSDKLENNFQNVFMSLVFGAIIQ